MKVKIQTLNNPSKKQKYSFGSGLNTEIMKTIKNSDVNRISDRFIKRNIAVDFKNNKVIAWCCEKTLDVIELLKKRYNIKFGLPSGIIVDDFENLPLVNSKMYGFCNMLPCELIKNKIVPHKMIFYNTFESQNKKQLYASKIFSWEDLDHIADSNFKNGISPTDYFLDMFFHEFAHAAHEENMIQKLGIKLTKEALETMNTKLYLESYQNKIGQLFVHDLCCYASKNPLDTVASDISKRFCLFLKNNQNTFIKSPYEHETILKRIFSLRQNVDFKNKILTQFYNGNFQI